MKEGVGTSIPIPVRVGLVSTRCVTTSFPSSYNTPFDRWVEKKSEVFVCVNVSVCVITDSHTEDPFVIFLSPTPVQLVVSTLQVPSPRGTINRLVTPDCRPEHQFIKWGLLY